MAVTLESNGNAFIEEITDGGTVDAATVWEALAMQSEILSKDTLTDINEQSGCDTKYKDVGTDTCKTLTHSRNYQRYFTYWKCKG